MIRKQVQEGEWENGFYGNDILELKTAFSNQEILEVLVSVYLIPPIIGFVHINKSQSMWYKPTGMSWTAILLLKLNYWVANIIEGYDD